MRDYTFDEYQELARRTQNPNLTIEQRRNHAIMGMIAEVGEICSIYQKGYQGHAVEREHLLKEVGDLMWFVSEYCDVENAYLSDVADANIQKLIERYPDGFSVEKSLHRREGDV